MMPNVLTPEKRAPLSRPYPTIHKSMASQCQCGGRESRSNFGPLDKKEGSFRFGSVSLSVCDLERAGAKSQVKWMPCKPLGWRLRQASIDTQEILIEINGPAQALPFDASQFKLDSLTSLEKKNNEWICEAKNYYN